MDFNTTSAMGKKLETINHPLTGLKQALAASLKWDILFMLRNEDVVLRKAIESDKQFLFNLITSDEEWT